MIIIFLIIVTFLNTRFAKNQAIGFYIKNLNLGGKVVGIVATYMFLIAVIMMSYIKNQSVLMNTFIYIIGSLINYRLYTIFYKFYLKKYKKEYDNDKFNFLLKHKDDLLNNIKSNFKLFELDDKYLEVIKRLKLIKGGIIGDSLLLPYEFLNKRKAQKRYLKHKLKQSLIEDNGMTSDDSDHLIMTYQSLEESKNKEDFQKILANKLKIWLFTLPIGIGFTTLKAIIKLLIGFSPKKSGINSLGNGPIMRVAIISSYFPNDEYKRNEYIQASTEITHNNLETIRMTQLIGNVIAYIYKNNKKPSYEDLLILLKCVDSPLTQKYIKILLENLNNDLDKLLSAIDSTKEVTGYIMTSSVFIIYVMHNSNNYKEAFEMIVKAGGDTDTIGAVIGSIFAILDEDMLNDIRLSYIFLTNNNDIVNYTYTSNLIKNLVSIPIILIHGILRWIK